jgi:hypothetical protein
MKMGAQINQSKAQMDADQHREGVKMGIDIAKSQQQANTTKGKTTK